jgi:hypothetical protein
LPIKNLVNRTVEDGCEYGLHRQISAAGHVCDVVSPAHTPRGAGDRVKTDRRDAILLARLARAGELMPVWVPDEVHEAVRDLVRGRAVAVKDIRQARQRIRSFLSRYDRRYAGAVLDFLVGHFVDIDLTGPNLTPRKCLGFLLRTMRAMTTWFCDAYAVLQASRAICAHEERALAVGRSWMETRSLMGSCEGLDRRGRRRLCGRVR